KVDEEAAVTIEEGAQEIKRTGDVEVADIDVPLLVRLEGLDEAGAFLGDVGRLAGQQSRFFEDAIDAGRAASDDIGIEHHEGHAAIAIEEGAQEIKGAGDVEVADVHVPLLVRLEGLHEAGSFLGDVGRLA